MPGVPAIDRDRELIGHEQRRRERREQQVVRRRLVKGDELREAADRAGRPHATELERGLHGAQPRGRERFALDPLEQLGHDREVVGRFADSRRRRAAFGGATPSTSGGFDQEPAENKRPREQRLGTPGRRVQARTAAQMPKSSGTSGPMPTGGDAAHRATAPVRLTVPSSARTARSSRKSSWPLSSSTAACRARTSSMAAPLFNHAASVSSPASVRAVLISSKSEPRPNRSRSRAYGWSSRKRDAIHAGPGPSALEPRKPALVQPMRTLRALRAIQQPRACTTSSPPNAMAGTRAHAGESADRASGEPHHGHEDAGQEQPEIGDDEMRAIELFDAGGPKAQAPCVFAARIVTASAARARSSRSDRRRPATRRQKRTRQPCAPD